MVEKGIRAKIQEYLEQKEKGSVVALKEIQEVAGTNSGYVYFVLRHLGMQGIVKRVEAGVWRVN